MNTMRVECASCHILIRWIQCAPAQEGQVSHGICPECAFRLYGLAGCGCAEHKDKCHHCWSWEGPIEQDESDDGVETYIVSTYRCLTCGELFDRETALDPYERRQRWIDRLEAEAEMRSDAKREERET